MQTKQTATQALRALAIASLLGLSSGAHALCVNADGSLGAVEMLPACGA